MTRDYPEDNRQRPFPPAEPVAGELANERVEPEVSEYNPYAIAAVGVGILGLVMLQIVFAPLAIILGALGVHYAEKNMPDTKRLAIGGYLLGIVDGIVWLILAAVFHITFFPL